MAAPDGVDAVGERRRGARSRSRRRCLARAAPIVVVLGLVGRFGLPGALGDVVGGVGYTGLVYLLIAWARPTAEHRRLAVAAFACSAAIELLQLTGIPDDAARAFSPARLVLGTSFAATDLVAYAAGALLAVVVDARLTAERRIADG